jgi:hypothetical protein
MPPKRSTPRKSAPGRRSVEAFPGEVVPFPGEDVGGQEMVEPWAAGGLGALDESVPLEPPGAPTTSPRPAVSSARAPPWGAMLCDWLLFGVSGPPQPPAQSQKEKAAAWTGMTAGRSPNKVEPVRSATTGKVWDERRQRFVTPKAVVQASAAAASAAAGLSDHLDDHLDKCRLEQEIGELFCCLFPAIHRVAGQTLTSRCFVMAEGSGPQGIGEHLATHKENVARRAAT